MILTYDLFITMVENWLSATTVHYAGEIYKMNFIMKIDDKSRISAQRGKSYPAAFITPAPMIIQEFGKVKYNVRIFLADKLDKDHNNYYTMINKLMMFLGALQQEIPHNFNKFIYPINVELPINWDDNVEGIFFDFGITATIPCFKNLCGGNINNISGSTATSGQIDQIIFYSVTAGSTFILSASYTDPDTHVTESDTITYQSTTNNNNTFASDFLSAIYQYMSDNATCIFQNKINDINNTDNIINITTFDNIIITYNLSCF